MSHNAPIAFHGLKHFKLGSDVPVRVVLAATKTGRIELETGADGVYLRFDGPCDEMIPFCKSACCALPGIDVSQAEKREDPNLRTQEGPDGLVMQRAATGWCVENHPDTKLCAIYTDRPQTCRDFHCTRGDEMRGWRLDLVRHKE